MTIELDSWAPAERQPGDFKRDSRGTPYVSHPDGATVKSGKRAGEVEWVRYGRPSGLGKQIESAYNLLRWKERSLVYGCLDPEVRRLADETLTGEPWTPEWKSAADGVVAAAARAAKMQEAAERGTHMHGVTEDDDKDRDWVHRAELGEQMGIPLEAQEAMLGTWQAMLATTGLEVLAVEVPVVNDRWRQAGTLDRIARLTKDLRFAQPDGTIVTLRAGTVIVLDLKTGKVTRDAKGIVQWWHTYAIQVACYADSIPYDTATETRGEWEWPVDADWAVIAHLPVTDALNGNAHCDLILVDLNAGRYGAELCMLAGEWESRGDLFADFHDVVEPKALPDPHRHAGLIVARPAPTDDGRIGDDALAAIVGRVAALPAEARAVLEGYALAAHAAGKGFNIRKEPSRRRHYLYRALLQLAEHFGADLEDDHVRAAVAVVLPEAGQLAVPLGEALGSLVEHEAALLLDVVLSVVNDDPALHYSDDGSPRWAVPTPATTAA